MYAPVGAGSQDAEEYLLGKKWEGDKGEVAKKEGAEAAGSLFAQQAAAAQDIAQVGGDYRDDMNKLREDPLLAIKRREKEVSSPSFLCGYS
jgi:hypothetical protein